MRFSPLGLLAGFTTSVLAEDFLFLKGLQYKEYDEAVALGFTTKVVTEAEWAALTTEDFSKFKAIVVPDPNCGSKSRIKFLEDSKDKWSPAVTGNIILIGTDPTFHFSQGKAKTLIDNSLKFAAAGTTPAGVPQTGLYFALSCYYESVASAKVDALSYFGDFTVRGNLACYNKVHLVASSGAMDSLDDPSLSGWSCSVHEAFSSYPSVGTNGFQALAIAQDILGVGSQTFGDGTVGLPYIISRGATPAKCGDGVWDKEFGEECDDGNLLNGDGCSLSCKCESGLPKGDGTCIPKNGTTPGGPTGTTPPTPKPTDGGPTGPYGNSSATPTYSYPGGTKTFTIPHYVTPACPTGPKIIGVEYVVEVTYSSTVYVPCATKYRPIYDVSTSILPCYACAFKKESITYASTDFVTVTSTTCVDASKPTYFPPVVKPCESCKEYTITETKVIGGPHTEYPPKPYTPPAPHVHTSATVVTYPSVTGTGYYTPTKTGGYAEYTGAAVAKEVKVAGAVGGAVLALAGLL